MDEQLRSFPHESTEDFAPESIAIIGMSCSFPDAQHTAQFWKNLREGKDSVRTFDKKTLRNAGVSSETLSNPSYIPKACIIEDIDKFDAEFFGISPQEAALLDPQQRLFMECVWNALEEAGYAPGTFEAPTGLFAGTRMSTYLYGLNSIPYIDAGSPQDFQKLIGNDKDYLASRISYKFNLKGPSMTVQCACSTSLVATHLACESLRSGESDMAIAGGAALVVPQETGFVYHEGMILSPDGCCRPFDAKANGTTFGNGAGAVVLKRLSDAERDGDHIWAVIRANAVNNDGSRKAGYTAPGLEGQMRVIQEALELSALPPESISYIETHGTGTPLGDPIEVEALTRVYRQYTDKKQFCSLGSVKANIGHLDSAAGVASLIKVALALKNKELPPTPNFTAPNPAINFAESPFIVNEKLRPWESSRFPRRAGVSSFGIGGTNAHLILEEAPAEQHATLPKDSENLFVLSAKNDQALNDLSARYTEEIAHTDPSEFTNWCFSSRSGRAHFSHRLAVQAHSMQELREKLRNSRTYSTPPSASLQPVFLFTGQGSHYTGMGKELYDSVPEFRQQLDACARILTPRLGVSLTELLFSEKQTAALQKTRYAQPALFAYEYALAKVWMNWGIQPKAMIGHSLGEYVAATLAGVFTLEDALELVATRAELMQSISTPGAMVAIFATEHKVRTLCEAHPEPLVIAAVNAPESLTVSGSFSAIAALCLVLDEKNISYRRLSVSHAFHSELMDPILDQFEKKVASLQLAAPQLRYISNRTGEFITAEMATRPRYWRQHLRESVLFSKGLKTLFETGFTTFLELGPHPVLSSLLTQCAGENAVTAIPCARRKAPALAQLLDALGQLYTRGASLCWEKIQAFPAGHRVPMPTYAFQKKSHWLRQKPTVSKARHASEDCKEMLSNLVWKPVTIEKDNSADATWLFSGETALFASQKNSSETHLNSQPSDELLPSAPLTGTNGLVCVIPQTERAHKEFVASEALELYQLTQKLKALVSQISTGTRLVFVTQGAQATSSKEILSAFQHAAWAILRCIRSEFPQHDIRILDLEEAQTPELDALRELLFSNALPKESALRAGSLLIPVLQKAQIPEAAPLQLQEDARYLITGGTGGIGRTLAEWLAFRGARHIDLVSRHKAPQATQAVIQALAAVGVTVQHHCCDISQRHAVEELLRELDHESTPLRGIFHLAGTNAETTQEEYIQALMTKGMGAYWLSQATENLDLDIFVLFSSITSLFGSEGLSAYGASNALLDALALERNRKGLPALSISWGAWDAGMTQTPGLKALFASKGIRVMPPRTGLSALELLLQSPLSSALVVDTDPEHFSPGVFADSQIFHSAKTRAENSGKTDADDIPERCDPETLQSSLAAQIRKTLRLPEGQPEPSADLISLGLDSLMFLGLSQSLSKKLGVHVGPGELFSHPTVEQLAQRLIELQENSSDTNAPQTLTVRSATANEPFDLTDIQYAYWIGRTESVELGSVACHTYFELDIANLDLRRFEKAWNQLIQRHGMLRCYFLSEGKQQILPVVPPYVIAQTDLRQITTQQAQNRLINTRESMAHLVHNASRWPLFEIQASRMQDSTRIHVSFDLLIADFHSITILMRELKALYEDETVQLEPLQLSFKDYIEQDQKISDTPEWKTARQYWRERLEQLAPPPALPLARRLSSIQTPRFSRSSCTIEHTTWARLKELAQEHGLTPSCLLLAVYAEVLRKWSTNTSFCINLTLFNRRNYHPQVNDIVGDFTSITLLEAGGQGDSFLERANRLQKQLWKDLEHSQYNGVQVIRDMNAKSGGKLGATMPVVFTANISGGQTNQLDSLMGELVHSESQTPQVWLDHQVFEQKNELVIMWDHVEGLFPEGMIEAMFQSNRDVLDLLARSPEEWNRPRLCTIPEKQRKTRQAANATEAPRSPELLHTLFLNSLKKHGARVAVSQGKKILTYESLGRRAAALAQTLLSSGCQKGERVGICLNKSWQQIVATLGILMSGAAYVPISPDMPAKRRDSICAKAHLTKVISHSELAKQEWPASVEKIEIDTLPETGPCAFPSVQTDPDDLAYVIFTSGSTGEPKGVMISHRGAVNTILDINTRFGLCEKDSILALSDLSFDLSVYDIFGALAAGAAITLPDADKTKEPEHWRQLLFTAGITVWNSAPALIRMLVEYAENCSRRLSPTLRLALLSGDWIPTDIPQRLQALTGECAVISLGGATEASIWSILHPIQADDSKRSSIPYGRPMANQKFHVLDSQLSPCPDWVPGSLFIEGDGLALGYLNDPQKTAESFLVHPRTSTRLYKTGDLGRYMDEGTLEFLGREDFQVKIRGHRVELGEIESALNSHDSVSASTVLVQGEQKGDRRLIAYVQTNRDGASAQKELHAHLKTLLPSYMLPAAYVCLKKLPVTANGKLDRKALPQVKPTQATAPQCCKPTTQTELILAEIWENILGQKLSSINEDFFEAGGDSLLAARFVLQVRKRLSQELPLAAIFENPNISALALLLSEETKPSSDSNQLRTPAQLAQFAVLPDDIQVASLPQRSKAEPEGIFLTGATGFLGTGILEALLSNTKAQIYCLVRAKDEQDGAKRIESALKTRVSLPKHVLDRITVLPGDLEKKRFGLDAQTFASLATQSDIIIHCGARVQYVYPYEALAAANVGGTLEALRLATSGETRSHFVYVSTSAAISPAGSTGKSITETSSQNFASGIYGGYPQSKWVAERLVRLAGERGLETSIFRPGTLWADSRTGAFNSLDFPSRLAQACLLLGSAPDIATPVAILPVDTAAHALVKLSLAPTAAGTTWNLLNPTMKPFNECVSDFSKKIELIPYPVWRSRLAQACAEDPNNPLTPLLPMMPKTEAEFPVPSQWNLSALEDALAKVGVPLPRINADIFAPCKERLLLAQAPEAQKHPALQPTGE
ncbi:hybrid non-ribosomal peptide synthetase/type I polyketide synthase [Desulfobaculum bizertense]|uniref:Amino acid adenylation domain-containing protein/thioester reductase domain-containing protein n=1 Tax=Desulfobaculum bizertense DSM 18034 TaxID=1121442 RepID=A0A1T4VSF8_9BACT|nr:hybrid non-ribosomal peptide synthetase/type I polyketide synthase [Desulfobaculum bizertense]SKA67775.1 amino acid adenylation domain-containing protein/thioester reductase domain-containing protein [Desulfobaculum bizertense DSM 18034]